jgi:hypothetical protein
LELPKGRNPARPPGYALAALITIEGSVLLLATGLAVASGRLRVLRSREGLLLGTAAGALFGISDIALTPVAANLVAIVGGVLIFRDSIGIGAAPIVGRWSRSEWLSRARP